MANKYKAFYNTRETDIEANTAWEAQQLAVKHFKPPKRQRHMVHVMICERADGSTVIHRATE